MSPDALAAIARTWHSRLVIVRRCALCGTAQATNESIWRCHECGADNGARETK